MSLLLKLSFLSALLFLAQLPAATANAMLSVDARARLLAGFAPTAADAGQPDVQRILQSSQWRAGGAHSMASLLSSDAGLFATASRKLMRQFFTSRLGPAVQDTRGLIYFFGGADVLYPDLVFPNLERTLLVGLEPPGELMDPERLLEQGTLAGRMHDVAAAFRDVMHFSFFITKHMSIDLQSFGTTTMIAVGLVTNGHRITSIEPVSIDDGGQLRTDGSGAVKGTRIAYEKAGGGSADVLYFRMDLSDSSLRGKPGFLRFVQHGFDTAFYKAASFVSHNSGFKAVNRLVLGSVRHVIENDDGIPFSAVRESGPSNWNVHLFGFYVPPAKLFGRGYEPDLLAAYDRAICTQGQSGEIRTWKQIHGSACAHDPGDLGYASIQWEGTVPFRYGYTPATGSASGPKSQFSNLIVLDRR